DRPYVRRDGRLQPATWNEAFATIAGAVKQTSGDRIGAIAGDLASVEEMYALMKLMFSLGSANIDCRQDGTKLHPSLGRASYIFGQSIESRKDADAELISAASAPADAAGPYARNRRRRRPGAFPTGGIGEAAAQRYA